MFDCLIGTIKEIKEQHVTLLVNGIGFGLSVPQTNNLEKNKSTEFYTYLHWNSENGPSLFGFQEEIDRIVFLMIIDCSKIGPKIALSVLENMTANEFLETISSQDEKRLSTINGIGEKKAENIIMQLKHKVSKLISSGTIKPSQTSGLSNYQTLSDALLSLGYTRQEITKTIQNLSKEANDKSLSFDQLMRRALSFLSKGI
ncbi:Holliday junction branch migration protein RuvA [Candidatus Babeliales bacterium]|nr:Holliday junction branch migration protein RuvA [Candidatus Babeliales bacterium]